MNFYALCQIVAICLYHLHYPIIVAAQPETANSDESETARYFSVPMHEVLRNDVFLKTTDYGEIAIAYADRSSDFKPNDYLTHADGIRFLTGITLQDFMKSGEREVIVPVIDDDAEKNGGSKLLGFVLIQPITPRKVSARRGEIVHNFNEGGPPPIMTGSNSDPDVAFAPRDYVPPPHGGGRCISGRDCYNFNGTCAMGQCACKSKEMTGSYCQLYRPASITMTAEQLRKKVRYS